jgi:hypothetical protein
VPLLPTVLKLPALPPGPLRPVFPRQPALLLPGPLRPVFPRQPALLPPGLLLAVLHVRLLPALPLLPPVA